MSAPTLVFIRGHYVNGRIVHYPGDECPPHTFSQDIIDQALDEGYLAECDPNDRPSLYRVLHRFSGCKEEQPLTKEQIAAHTLEE